MTTQTLKVVFIGFYRQDLMLAMYDPVSTGANYDHQFQSLYKRGKLTERRLFQIAATVRIGINHLDSGLNVLLVVEGPISEKAMGETLEQIRTEFILKLGTVWQKEDKLALNERCKPIFETAKRRIESKEFAKVAIIQENLSATVDQMNDNLETALMRGQEIEHAHTSSQHLAQAAHSFNRSSSRLRCSLYWGKIRWILLGLLIALILIFFIILLACGGFKFPKCRKDEEK